MGVGGSLGLGGLVGRLEGGGGGKKRGTEVGEDEVMAFCFEESSDQQKR